MWQTQGSRKSGGGGGDGRGGKRDRALHLKRVTAEVRPVRVGLGAQAPSQEARILLNDFSEHGVGVFLKEQIPVGTDINLTLEVPGRVFIRGRVVACRPIDGESHILSPDQYRWRGGIRFMFQSDAERTEVQAFCAKLLREHVYVTDESSSPMIVPQSPAEATAAATAAATELASELGLTTSDAAPATPAPVATEDPGESTPAAA